MTISEYDVLLQLSMAEDRRLRMRDLVKATLFSPSGLTRLCERLEARELVTRERARGIRERFISRMPDDELENLSEGLNSIAGDPADVAASASTTAR